jgi:flavin reductase (DIM6/NTAB) family NADH-FMN oxidoreductase RutF/rubredoxin
MDARALYKFSSGLYVVSATDADGSAGCVINTGLQLTSSPLQVEVVVNKQNATERKILSAGHFALCPLDKTADMEFVGRFGFRSSADFDKFAGIGSATTTLGDRYPTEHVCAMLACRVVSTLDVGTHMVFVGEVLDAEVLGDAEPLTYSYYHAVLKGKTPPRASSYVDASAIKSGDGSANADDHIERGSTMADEKKTYKFVCTVCGYEVEVDTPELPEDFVCPVCGVGPDQFERVDE